MIRNTLIKTFLIAGLAGAGTVQAEPPPVALKPAMPTAEAQVLIDIMEASGVKSARYFDGPGNLIAVMTEGADIPLIYFVDPEGEYLLVGTAVHVKSGETLNTLAATRGPVPKEDPADTPIKTPGQMMERMNDLQRVLEANRDKPRREITVAAELPGIAVPADSEAALTCIVDLGSFPEPAAAIAHLLNKAGAELPAINLVPFAEEAPEAVTRAAYAIGGGDLETLSAAMERPLADLLVADRLGPGALRLEEVHGFLKSLDEKGPATCFKGNQAAVPLNNLQEVLQWAST